MKFDIRIDRKCSHYKIKHKSMVTVWGEGCVN